MDSETKPQKKRFEFLPLIFVVIAFPQLGLSLFAIRGTFVNLNGMADFLFLLTLIIFAIAYIGAFIDFFFRMAWPFWAIAATLFCWLPIALWMTIDLYRNPVMNSEGPKVYADYSYAWMASIGTFYLFILFALSFRLAWTRRTIWYNSNIPQFQPKADEKTI